MAWGVAAWVCHRAEALRLVQMPNHRPMMQQLDVILALIYALIAQKATHCFSG